MTAKQVRQTACNLDFSIHQQLRKPVGRRIHHMHCSIVSPARQMSPICLPQVPSRAACPRGPCQLPPPSASSCAAFINTSASRIIIASSRLELPPVGRCLPSQPCHGGSQHLHSPPDVGRRGKLIRPMAPAVEAGDENHGGGRNLRRADFSGQARLGWAGQCETPRGRAGGSSAGRRAAAAQRDRHSGDSGSGRAAASAG